MKPPTTSGEVRKLTPCCGTTSSSNRTPVSCHCTMPKAATYSAGKVQILDGAKYLTIGPGNIIPGNPQQRQMPRFSRETTIFTMGKRKPRNPCETARTTKEHTPKVYKATNAQRQPTSTHTGTNARHNTHDQHEQNENPIERTHGASTQGGSTNEKTSISPMCETPRQSR